MDATLDPYPVKRGDTAPPVRGTLLQADGRPLPLPAGTTVRFIMAPAPGLVVPTVAGDCTIVDVAGRVEYPWQLGDTAIAGIYRVEFEVTFADGSVRTVPTEGWLDFEIFPDLD